MDTAGHHHRPLLPMHYDEYPQFDSH